MKDFEPVIGLEIHVELLTKSKMFCQCSTDFFGKRPNTQVCPVCLGLPGALPVPNKKAIEWTIKIGKALNCKINQESKFDRKHYFYPDLPKGYQISQYDEPIAINGSLKLKVKSEKLKVEEKKYRIRRVHLEEDTGKLVHEGKNSLVDFNRSGVPLVEIVTEPDFSSSDEVKRFLEELHTIIRYLGVSDANMDQGSMRLEPNISIKTSDKLPDYKVEVKNINSFRFVKRAIDFETERQSELLKQGKKPVQETRGFNEKKRITVSQRTKEEAQDYRYFPEPDIPPLTFTQKFIEEVEIPELPSVKMYRYIETLKVREADAFILTRHHAIAEYFESVMNRIKNKQQAQSIANLIVNKKIDITLPVQEFIKQAEEKASGKETDPEVLKSAIVTVLEAHPNEVRSYKSGKVNVIMYFVGQVMKELKGQTDPQVVRKELEQKLRK